MGLAEILAGAMLASLVLYALLGGADFGGGIWELFARGPREREQRTLVEQAIGPVWEANHVWLVLIVVILFTAFPAAFAAASIQLHIPLTLILIGIVFRGSAFVFLKVDARGARFERRWKQMFAVSSALSPFFLGVTLGAVASGGLGAGRESSGAFVPRFVLPWLHPIPLLVGALAPCMFAFLAAVYLTLEAQDPKLCDDFRKRAFVAGGASLVLAAVTAVAVSSSAAIGVREALLQGPWAWILVGAVAGAWFVALYGLFIRRYKTARFGAAGVVTLMLCGWALWQYPYLIRPDIKIRDAAAPEATLRALAIALGVGALVLFPSMAWLLRVFKGHAVFGSEEAEGE